MIGIFIVSPLKTTWHRPQCVFPRKFPHHHPKPNLLYIPAQRRFVRLVGLIVFAQGVDPQIFQQLKIPDDGFIGILLIIAIRIDPGFIGAV